MYDLIKAFREALGIESSVVFVVIVAMIGGGLAGSMAWLVDRAYKSALAREAAAAVEKGFEINLKGITMWSYGPSEDKAISVMGLIVQVVNRGTPQGISAWKCEIAFKADAELRPLKLLPPDANFVPPAGAGMDGREAFLPENSIFDKVLAPIETYGQRVGCLICSLPPDVKAKDVHLPGTRVRVSVKDVIGHWWDSDIWTLSSEQAPPDVPFFVPGMKR